MITYEVHVLGKEQAVYTFESAYRFEPQERVFLPNQAEGISYVIVKITHDITSGKHVVRLNCMIKKSLN